jgi:hypothetical protein
MAKSNPGGGTHKDNPGHQRPMSPTSATSGGKGNAAGGKGTSHQSGSKTRPDKNE